MIELFVIVSISKLPCHFIFLRIFAFIYSLVSWNCPSRHSVVWTRHQEQECACSSLSWVQQGNLCLRFHFVKPVNNFTIFPSFRSRNPCDHRISVVLQSSSSFNSHSYWKPVFIISKCPQPIKTQLTLAERLHLTWHCHIHSPCPT